MANHKLSQSLGDFVSQQTRPQGLYIQTTHGSLEVVVYRPAVVRFRANLMPSTREDFSYAVVAQPEANDFQVVDDQDVLTLTTGLLTVELSKFPLRVRCLTPDGATINEDDPAFGTAWMGDQVTTYKKLQPGERFLGLGEKTGNLDRRGAAYVNWNTDSFAYGPDSDPLYASFPFYLGVVPPYRTAGGTTKRHGLAYGIFMDNSYRSYFNFGASNDRFASFAAEDGEMDYYFFHGSVAEILADYTWLTGRMPLPPRWSLGYQQCRYSYYPDKEVLNLARTFREKQIPADVIHLDIHHMDAYKIFSWDHQRFAEHRKLLAELKAMGFEVVVICDPGIKVEPGYAAYEEGLAQDIFVKYPDGTNHTAQVWPGWCHFPDFTNPRARAWWAGQLQSYLTDGIRGFWNDMNEPASWGQRNPDLVEHDFEGQRASHRQAHNIYGLQMCRSTFEGAKQALAENSPPGERPFVLTRAAYNGIQRYAAVWTGDNTSSDDHMLAGVRLVNSLGLTGVAFAGYDVGGFVGEPSVALFARWISLGAFAPFFRGHTMINTRDQEPWAFGEEVEAISRNYISLRYRLLPYIYATFYEATQNGLPVARSLAIAYTHDAKIYDPQYQNEYLFGEYLLVAPVVSTKELAKIYLPDGMWYNLYDNQMQPGEQELVVECPLETLPVFVRAGAIVPMQSLVQHTGQATDGTLHLHVYYLASLPGFENEPFYTKTSFVYYEDDGRSYAHEMDNFYRRVITYSDAEGQVVLGEVEGRYPSQFTTIKLILHGFDEIGERLLVNGQAVAVHEERLTMIESIASFDPLGRENLTIQQINKVAVFANENGEMVVSW